MRACGFLKSFTMAETTIKAPFSIHSAERKNY